jgi:hypothetical protein
LLVKKAAELARLREARRLLAGETNARKVGKPGNRKMGAATRAKMAEAQRARWARTTAGK